MCSDQILEAAFLPSPPSHRSVTGFPGLFCDPFCFQLQRQELFSAQEFLALALTPAPAQFLSCTLLTAALSDIYLIANGLQDLTSCCLFKLSSDFQIKDKIAGA